MDLNWWTRLNWGIASETRRYTEKCLLFFPPVAFSHDASTHATDSSFSPSDLLHKFQWLSASTNEKKVFLNGCKKAKWSEYTWTLRRETEWSISVSCWQILKRKPVFFFFLLNTNVNFNYVFFRCQVQQLSGHFNILAFSLKKPNSDWQEEERIGLKEAEV